MKKVHTDGSFGLTWFWITWDMQIIPHGQDDWRPRIQWDGTREQLVGSNTFDVCSPMSADARSGYRYVLTSQMIWVDVKYIYLMKQKSKLLKGSSNFRVKLKIIVTRGCNVYDMIIEMSICVTNFGTQLRHCGNCFTINTAWNTIVWWCIRTS